MPLFYHEDIAWDNLAIMEASSTRAGHALARARASTEMAARLADLSLYHPTLDPAVLTAAAVAGINPGDEGLMEIQRVQYQRTAQQLQQLRAAKQPVFDEDGEKAGIFHRAFDPVARVAKGAVRGTFLAFDTLWEEGLQRPLRALVRNYQGSDTPHEDAGASVGVRAFREWRAGRPVNLGSGFFANSELSEETVGGLQAGQGIGQAGDNAAQQALGAPLTQQWQEQKEQTQITSAKGNSVGVSPGRLLTYPFLEPGTKPFSAVSGLLDFGANIFLDPSNIILAGAGKARKAANVLVPDSARKTVLNRTWQEYLTSPDGTRLANFVADTDDYQQIHRMIRSREHLVDSQLAKALTEARTPDEVIGILIDAGGQQTLSKALTPQSLIGRAAGGRGAPITQGLGSLLPGKAGELGAISGVKAGLKSAVDNTYLGRLGAMTGSHVIKVDDIDQAVTDIAEFGKSAGLSEASISKHMLNMATFTGDELNYDHVFRVVRDVIDEFGEKLIADGLPEPVVKKFTNMFTEVEAYRNYWLNNSGKAMSFPGAKHKWYGNGDLRPMPSAHLFSEFLQQSVPLLDAGKVRKALRTSAATRMGLIDGARISDWNDFAPMAITNLVDATMQKMWKPLVLLRLAWPVRVIGEEQFRMAGAGLTSAIRHPIEYIGWAISEKRGNYDVLGQVLADSSELQAAASRRGALGLFDRRGKPRAVFENEFYSVDRNHYRAGEGHANQIGRLALDEIAPVIARRVVEELKAGKTHDTIDLADIKEWFSAGEGKRLLERLARDGDRWNLLTNRAAADGYIDSVWARIVHMSGGDFRYFSWEDQKWYDSYGKTLDLPHPPKYQTEVPGGRYNTELNDLERAIDEFDAGNIDNDELLAQVERVRDSWDIELDKDPWAVDETGGGGPPGEAGTLDQRLGSFYEEIADIPYEFPDPADQAEALADTLGRMRSEVERARSMGRVGADPQTTEYIPTVEAAGLSLLSRDDAEKVFSKIDPIGQLVPTPTEMPNGIVAHPPLNGRSESFFVKNGEIHGHVIVDNSRPTHGPEVKIIHTSGEITTTEATRFFMQAFGQGLDDPSQLVDVVMRGKPVREWLRAALGPDDARGLNTVEELIEKAREVGFHKLSNPIGSELTTPDGSSAIATMIKLAYRGGDNPLNPKNWPQHRKQYEVFGNINPDIIDAIATGTFGDGLNFAESATNEKLQKKIIEFVDNTWRGNRPEFVHVAKEVEPTGRGQFDAVVERMFQTLMTTPTNKLSRSPAFKQFYWKRVAQLSGYADEAVQRQIIEMAQKAGLDKRSIRNWAVDHLKGVDDATMGTLDRLAGPGHSFKGGVIATDGGGIDDIAHLDQIAKAFALEETKRLLYDLSTKHNISQMTRNIFPFGEAWFEIFSSWSRIMMENPQVIRRLQQGIEGGRDSGFFYPDPSTGEEMFNYPGGELLGKWMFGPNENQGGFLGNITAGVKNLASEGQPNVTPQLAGRVQGLNLMAGSFMPGVGPLVQIPASKLKILEAPEQRWLRDLILPFGASDVDSLGSLTDDIMPAWFKKALVGIGNPTGDNERLYANTVIDVYKALILSGAASDDTPENADAALEMAKEKAKSLYRFRAFVQFAGPTGPSLRFDARDKNGELWAFQSLATLYREMTIAADYNHAQATEEFVTMFGLDPSLLYTSKSVQLKKRSVTQAGVDWQARNPEVFNAYDLTAYYANPDKPNDPFDYNAYLLQLEEKSRTALTPEQWNRERNDFLGRLAYEKARKAVGARTDDAAINWLRTYRFDLMERLPGYNEPTVGLPRGATRDQVIAELKRWERNDKIAVTDAGQGVITYMQARQMAVDYAMTNFGITENGFRTAKKTKYLRNWLRQVGSTIIKEHPDFGPVWESVLFREIEEPVVYDNELLGEDFSV